VFAPDSRKVAFIDVHSPGLWVWEFATGKAPRKLSTSVVWSVQCLSFTRDSDGILFNQGGELVTLDVKTGEPVSHFSILSPRTTRHTSQGTGGGNLCLGPAGDRVAVSNSAGFSVDVWDLRTGRLLYGLPQRAGIVYWLAWSPDGRRLAVARSDGDVTIWNLTAVEQSLAQLRLSP
jgi:YD repeat-containing protein